jgi:hypothetical protein
MSNRPDYVKDEDIARWSKNIDTDPQMPKLVLESPTLREVCYAGLYLAEELDKLSCPSEKITQIQFTAGRMCFGRNPWIVSDYLIKEYKAGNLRFEEESNLDLN